MPRRRFQLLLLIVVAAASAADPLPAIAQNRTTVEASDTLWQIELSDGSTIFGRVTAATPQRITVTTAAGVTLEVERDLIRSMAPARGTVHNGVVWPDDPNTTRLFFGPTGRLLAAGEGYIGAFELFLPFVSYGVTNFLTLAGGTPIVPNGMGEIFYFAPKVGGRIAERTSLSGGVLALYNADSDVDDDFRTAGVLYGVATRGTDDNAVTLGVGWGFAGDEVENRPVFLLGLEARASPRVKLISENYLITFRKYQGEGTSDETGVGSLLSAGIRFFGQRLSADAGLGVVIDDDDIFCCVPLVNFVYNFK